MPYISQMVIIFVSSQGVKGNMQHVVGLAFGNLLHIRRALRIWLCEFSRLFTEIYIPSSYDANQQQ